MKILYSIVLPVYNVEKYLDECIGSLSLLATHSEIEIIAVNDGSLDSSPEILEKWSRSLPCLKVISQNNRGLSAARNRGLAEAQGDYVVFIDSDDYIDSDELLRCLMLTSENGADIGVGDFLQFTDGSSEKSELHDISLAGNYVMNGADFFIRHHKEHMSVVWRDVFRRDYLLEHKLFFHEGVLYEDMEFTPIAFYNASVIYTGCRYYKYRIRPNSIVTGIVSHKGISDSIKIAGVLKSFSQSIDNKVYSKIVNGISLQCFVNKFTFAVDYLERDEYQYVRNLFKGMEFSSIKYSLTVFILRLFPQYKFRIFMKWAFKLKK